MIHVSFVYVVIAIRFPERINLSKKMYNFNIMTYHNVQQKGDVIASQRNCQQYRHRLGKGNIRMHMNIHNRV